MKTAAEIAIAIIKAGNVTTEIADAADKVVRAGTDSNFISAVAGANTSLNADVDLGRDLFLFMLREYYDEVHLDELMAQSTVTDEELEAEFGDINAALDKKWREEAEQ